MLKANCERLHLEASFPPPPISSYQDPGETPDPSPPAGAVDTYSARNKCTAAGVREHEATEGTIDGCFCRVVGSFGVCKPGRINQPPAGLQSSSAHRLSGTAPGATPIRLAE